MNKASIALQPAQISFFNPGRLTDEQIELAFVARQKLFVFIFEKIIAEQPNDIPQHLLIIGERGMGKSTLLHRLAVELRKKPYNETFIPLTFPEEQYNVDRLSKFWLNCLDALADALDRNGINPEILTELDANIQQWARQGRDITAAAMYDNFCTYCQRLQRRPVLLVDNLNLVLDTLKTEEKHTLRALLTEKDAPVLVGAGVQVLEDAISYTSPFYDAFQAFHLKKLSFEEAVETLRNLASITHNSAFLQHLASNQGRLRALYQLTGGTPRTLTMLYPLIRDGFSENIQTDLEGLMDVATALYKARFEELPPQMQVVLDAVALHWDPVHIEMLRQITHLDSAQLSPQLKRLLDIGWLTRLDAYQAKGSAYEISERFLNIWYLMRRSTRRRKKELLCLTKFLTVFYGEDLPNVAKQALQNQLSHKDHASFHLALADALKDKKTAQQLRHKSYQALLDLAERDVDILKSFIIPQAFVSEKEKAVSDELGLIIASEDYEAACKKAAFLISLNPGNAQYYVLWGFLLTENKQYAQSELAFQKAIDLDANYAAAWNNLGNLYQNHLNRYSEAEMAYQRAIDFAPNYAVAWFNLGNLYQNHLNLYSEAEMAYQRAIDLAPNYALAWFNLGNLYQNHLNLYSEAEAAYLKAIDLDPNNAVAWMNLGCLYQNHLNRYSEAESAYQKAIELDANDAAAWNNLGNLYQYCLNRYSEAESAYLKVIALDANYTVAWYNLGYLYQDHLNRYSEAESAYQKAITLDPNFAPSFVGLGNLYQDYLHRYPEAEATYLSSPAVDQEKHMTLHNLIFLYRDKMGQVEKARTIFDTLSIEKALEDCWYLQSALFAFHDKNLGIAAAELEKALNVVNDGFVPNTRGDWWRFAAAIHSLGYSSEVLIIMEKTGHNLVLRPFYEAVKTLAEGTSDYLNSIAVEVRDSARLILEKIRLIGNMK